MWLHLLLPLSLLFNTINKTNEYPNILWISVEDMSPHLGVYGEKIARTPHLDALSKESIVFKNAFSTAGVCAPSRAAIITACHQWTIGAQHMRTQVPNMPNALQNYPPGYKSYSALLPENLTLFPQVLREHGYYCTNNEKQDYQFEAPVTLWNENSNKAHWRNRPSGKPFFSVFNLMITHESQVWTRAHEPLKVNPEDIPLPVYYPDTKNVRLDVARHLTNVMNMDSIVGDILQQLKKDNLYENTIIFFWSDHGDGLPNVKREIYDRGIRVPLMIRIPKKYQQQLNLRSGFNHDLVSLLDLGPTVLSLAGIKPSNAYQGKPFLGKYTAGKRKYIFSGRDRMDSEYDRVRGVHDGRFTFYINYSPEKPYYQNISYRLQQAGMRDILKLKEGGQLNNLQNRWFETKPEEELYDICTDPNEFINLIHSPDLENKKKELKKALQNQLEMNGDFGAINEMDMVKKFWHGDKMPVTANAEIIKSGSGIKIKSIQPGTTIAYQLSNTSTPTSAWLPYINTLITKKENEYLIVRSHRIGYSYSDQVIQ
ncbi:MAG: sulfatase [Saprospiraceae bacterium]|nr:sulfatase [Saprospiraceae bacterium]